MVIMVIIINNMTEKSYKNIIDNVNKSTNLNFDWILSEIVPYIDIRDYDVLNNFKMISNVIIDCCKNNIPVHSECTKCDLFITIPKPYPFYSVDIIIKSGYLPLI